MVLAASANAQVVDTSATASVNVQPALSVTLITSPSWGQVTRPPTGSADYKLDYSTGAVTLLSGDGYAFDDGQVGEYTLSGAPSAPVSFSVSIGSFSGTGVTVVASHINGTTNAGTDNLDGSGDLDLKIGGVLSIAANASIETQTATVTLTVDYQ